MRQSPDVLLGELREGRRGERTFYLGPKRWLNGHHGAFRSEGGCMPKPVVWLLTAERKARASWGPGKFSALV